MSTVQDLIDLLADYRYLAAVKVYQAKKEQEQEEALSTEEASFLASHDDAIQRMLERVTEIEQTLAEEDEDEQDWILGSTLFGVKTSYRQVNEEDTSLMIKMEGILNDLPIFEQCAVIHEIDLFKTWLPFCPNSVLIHKPGKADVVGYVHISVPPMSRDFIIQAYGADCLLEHGKIIILGRSIDQYEGGVEVPLLTEGWFHKRLILNSFKAVITIISPTEARTKIICNIDPRIYLPQLMINFIMKNLAGVFLYLFQQQALKVSKNPDCEHAKRIRENRVFYKDWVLRKLNSYCALNGWAQPVVSSLSGVEVEGSP